MSITATTKITWTKLRNGSWGIKGFDLTEGEQVTVTKKSGETKTATVGKVIWTGTDGMSIATRMRTLRRTRSPRPVRNLRLALQLLRRRISKLLLTTSPNQNHS